MLDYCYLPSLPSPSLSSIPGHYCISLHFKNFPQLLWNPANANKILFHAERRPLAPGDINLPTIAHAEAQLNHGKPIVLSSKMKWKQRGKERAQVRKIWRFGQWCSQLWPLSLGTLSRNERRREEVNYRYALITLSLLQYTGNGYIREGLGRWLYGELVLETKSPTENWKSPTLPAQNEKHLPSTDQRIHTIKNKSFAFSTPVQLRPDMCNTT